MYLYRKQKVVAAVLLFVIGLFGFAPSQALGAHKKAITVHDLYKLGRVSSLEVSPDGQKAAFVVKSFCMDANKGSSSIWLADLKSNQTRRLTNHKESDWSPRWISSSRLAFLSTRSGSVQMWSIPTGGGEASKITDLPASIDSFQVSKDGKFAAIRANVFPGCRTMACNKAKFAAKEKDPVKAKLVDSLMFRVWDHWLDETRPHILWVSIDGKKGPKDLTPGDWWTSPFDLGGYFDLSISPSGKSVAFTANMTKNPAWNTNNDVYVVNVAGGVPQNITKKNKGADAEPIFSPDGKYIAYTAMARPGFEADRHVLTLYNVKTKKHTPLTDKLDRSVSEFTWSPDSKAILFNALDNGRKAIFEVVVPTGEVKKIVAGDYNKNPRYFDRGTKIAFLGQTVALPAEVFVASRNGDNVKRISHINDSVLENIEMGKVEDMYFEGAGGDKVHGLIIKPPGFNPKKKYPVVLLIHGGPQGSFGLDFHFRWNYQMFASPGFVVATIDFHGSRGYGQKFTDSISGDWGGKPYEDIMLGVDHIQKTYSFVDKKNISAAGASYGGFMINWILGHTDRFESLVSHDGVYDQVSMYGSTEELWFPEWEMKGTPWTNPELYEKSSPSSYAANFKTPTLIIHGELDYRIPYSQAFQLFSALQRQNVESRLLFFPDENHFVQKPKNAKLWWGTVLSWLADHAGVKWKPPIKKRKGKSVDKKIKKIAN